MTLGISVNTRTVAMAVLDGDFLYDYRISFFKERWGQVKLKKIIRVISEYAASYKIKAVLLIEAELQYLTNEMQLLLDGIKEHFEKDNLSVRICQFADLQPFYDGARAKRRTLMQTLVDRFPELVLAQRKEQQNRKKYYTKLFEACRSTDLHTTH